MTDKDILIMNLQSMIEKILMEEGIDKKDIRVFLFGSAIYKKQYNDIDIVVVYNSLDYSSILRLRDIIRFKLNSMLEKEIDIVLLSEKEAKNNSFIAEEKCELIF